MPNLFGPYGGLPDSTEVLSASRANAVWFHGFQADLFERADRLGLAACVEFRTFRDDLDARPHLRPIGVDGAPIRFGSLVQGVCLSRTDFIAERETELTEGLASFSPAGVWLDYLTYPGWFETPTPDLQESCFCDACVAAFNEATGVDCSDPRRILTEHPTVWHEYKCARIEGFARRFAAIVQDAAPGAVLGLYACPWYPEEFDGALTRIFAQDLNRLAPVFDAITPLLYATKCGRAADWAARYLDRAAGFIPASTRVEPIVDVLEFPENLEALAERAGRTGARVDGMQIFGGARVFEDEENARRFDDAVAAFS